MARIVKYLEYRRIMWLVEPPLSLESQLREAWAALGSSIDRTVRRADQSSMVGLRGEPMDGGGFAIHCAKYVDGQGVGIVPMAPAQAVIIGERAPDEGQNFLQNDLMALIHGNHVISVNAGINAAPLRLFLCGLFDNAGMHEDSGKFDLIRCADVQQIHMIEAAGGVERVDLRVALSEAAGLAIAADAPDENGWHGAAAKMWEALSAIIDRDEQLDRLGRAQKGTATLTINVPKRDLEAAKMGLDYFARTIIDDDEADNYIIRLRNGQIIKPDEISVRKKVTLLPHANSFDVNDAWTKMQVYLGELRQGGQLEV